MHDRIAHFILAAVLVLLPLTAGCSLIGLIGGAAGSSSTKTLSGWDVVSVEPGRHITLSMKSGHQVDGRYRGSTRNNLEGYQTSYDDWIAQRTNQAWFPELASPVTITPDSGEYVTGTFYGFDFGKIYVTSSNRGSIWDLADVNSISDSTGAAVAGVTLMEETTRGTVPLYNTFFVDTKEAESDVEFDLRDVETVVVHGQNYAGTGFLVGLAIDAAIVVANSVGGSTSPPSHGSGSGGSSSGSCPFVYSYDGDDYVFDAEPLGGLFFEGAARSDFVRLNHLRASDGKYRLRVATELDETDYIDAVKLHVVDHPERSELVPTFDGRMMVLTDPIKPNKAIAHSGWNALPAVRERDGDFWTSNPFNRDPRDPSQLRDGIEIEFARPAGASSATLAITVKNLEWTDHIGGDVFSLAGEDLEAWYDQLNNDPKERGAFLGTVIREALLRVEVWNGQVWQSSGSVIAMGPRIETDRALQIKLPDSGEDVTRIRLSAMAGMWMIDRVAIDYTATSPVSISIADPVEAIDQSRRNVLRSFEASDKEYHEMPEIGDYVNLVFSAPPPPASGLVRTVVIEMSGYYKLHINSQGPANRDLIQELMAVPGALSQWALDNLNRSADQALASWSD